MKVNILFLCKLLLAIPCLTRGVLHAEELPDFNIEAKSVQRLVKAGEKLLITVDFSFPEDRVLAGWHLGAYLPYVPTAFASATGRKVNVHQDRKWSSISISGWHWLHGDKRLPGKQEFEVTTENWPAGDYNLELRGLFRDQDNPEVATDIYRSGHFYLTIIEP